MINLPTSLPQHYHYYPPLAEPSAWPNGEIYLTNGAITGAATRSHQLWLAGAEMARSFDVRHRQDHGRAVQRGWSASPYSWPRGWSASLLARATDVQS